MQAQLADQANQIAALKAGGNAGPAQTTVTTTTSTTPGAPEEDGVYVTQWRNVDIEGDIVKKDVIENQYYDAATFARLNEEVAGDEAKRTGFSTLGIEYKITKDLRKSKK